MMVYIVEGRCGEYSDHRTWNVCAYMNRESAKAKVADLTQKVAAAKVKFGEEEIQYAHSDSAKEIAEFIGDPYFQSDYTGTSYYLSEVDVVDLGWTSM
jgi:hypothetical protein